MALFSARAPIDDRRLFTREGLVEGRRVGWLDPEAELRGWWLDFSAGGVRMALIHGEAPEPGALLRGWAQDPRAQSPREFLALDLSVCWSYKNQGRAEAGCRFERLGRFERLALEELAQSLRA